MPAPQIAAAPAAPALPRPQHPPLQPPVTPGTAASRRLLNPEHAARPITLWGSSSMSSEGGEESTPLPIRIHDHLSLAAAPAPVHAFGVGATKSVHTVLMRGLLTPTVIPEGTPPSGSTAFPVRLDPGPAPQGPLRIPGTITPGSDSDAADGRPVPGLLDGSTGSWFFTPDDSAQRPVRGTFSSALAAVAEGSRQVLWMGKNNILETDRVLADTQLMWDAAADPEHDTLVLGQWPTDADPIGSATGDALREVNAEQQERYGDHFLDLLPLLVDERGLRCTSLAPLRVLEQASTHEALERGVVPPVLVAADGIHLNGWGNLAVSWAIVQRMRELGWL